jgi:uncharacterized membrane protein YhhN
MSAPAGTKDRTSGTYWLVVGGILIAIAVVVLALLVPQEPSIAWPAIIVDVVLFVVMVIARLVVRPIVPRQWTLAICLLAASVLSLGALYLIVLAER